MNPQRKDREPGERRRALDEAKERGAHGSDARANGRDRCRALAERADVVKVLVRGRIRLLVLRLVVVRAEEFVQAVAVRRVELVLETLGPGVELEEDAEDDR